jgi:LmbE family N-acetylglucosaminyl deacetylase
MKQKHKTVLSIQAHPDDAEFTCAGTLALLKNQGWQIHIATMTPGDCGSATHSRPEISVIRRQEAANAAELLGGQYHCLECEDVFIMYDKSTLLKVINLIRKARPTIIITHSPQDYFIDHENTSHLARTACFACGIPNVETPGVEAYGFTPYLYYADAMEGKNIFGNPIPPTIYVDISSTIATKEQMLCCHKSQRDWLMAHHGMDEYTASMRRYAGLRGSDIKVKYAEAFRQHLGHGYPQDNLLKQELSSLVTEQR